MGIGLRLGFVVLLLLAVGGRAGAAPPPEGDGKAEAGVVPLGARPTKEQRQRIWRRVLSHPLILERLAGHRLKGIRITLGTLPLATGGTKTVATAVLFDHTVGEARRVLMDTVTGELVADERLPGRPQGSPEEFEEAVQMVRDEPELARLMDAGGVLDGGFIVTDPLGSRRRMMQLKLLSADRRSLLRTIVVDLTRGTIASVSTASNCGAKDGNRATAAPAERVGS